MSVGKNLWIWGKIMKWKEKGKVGATMDFASCSVLVYVSLLSAEAVYEQTLLLGNHSVGAEVLSSGEEPGGNTWGSGRVGGQRVGRGGFIVAPVVWVIWRALEVALWRRKSMWQTLAWRKWDMREGLRWCVKVLALVRINKGVEGDSLDRRELRS